MGGIYKISCAANRHLYIGSAKDFNKRWAEHRQLLTKNKHYNSAMQTAWNRFGDRQFAFAIVENIGDEDVEYYLAREASYIHSFRSKGVQLFNTKAMGPGGRVFSQDKISAKISNTLKYKALDMSSEERKAVWGKGRLGKKLSEEHKRKMSTQLCGQRRSVEVRRRMSVGQKESFANNLERKEAIRVMGKRNAGRIPANAIRYVVDGVEYPSGSSAMKALGITSQELFRMVRFGRASRKLKVEVASCVRNPPKDNPKGDPSCVQVQPPLYNREDGVCEDGFGFYI
jgi:group I intron endonuclease